MKWIEPTGEQSKASGKRRTTYLPSVEYRAALYPLQLELSAPKTERRTKSEEGADPGLQLNFKTYADLCLFVCFLREERRGSKRRMQGGSANLLSGCIERPVQIGLCTQRSRCCVPRSPLLGIMCLRRFGGVVCLGVWVYPRVACRAKFKSSTSRVFFAAVPNLNLAKFYRNSNLLLTCLAKGLKRHEIGQAGSKRPYFEKKVLRSRYYVATTTTS